MPRSHASQLPRSESSPLSSPSKRHFLRSPCTHALVPPHRCYIGWKRLKPALEDEERLKKEYGFTLRPKFLPYLINEDLDERPVTKKELYESKFMGGSVARCLGQALDQGRCTRME